MSARRSRKRHDESAAPPREPEAPAPPADDEIEILEVTGVNETETPVREHAVPAPAPAGPPEPAPTGDLEEAQRERAHYRDLWKRQQAEFDNFRKRAERDAEQRRLTDAAGLVARLLPVLDNLEAAVAASNSGPEDPVRRGLALIQKQMLDLLGKEGLAEVPTVGTRFDPALHDAVEVVRDETAGEGAILAELRKGYTFKDRLIRAALVRVAAASGAAGDERETAAAG